ncbi:MAG: hypothetical protein ACI4JM_13065 [Oscillospiraceae bacterium]
MKKKIGKFLIQSLIIFLIWAAGQAVIYLVDFENHNAVTVGWLIITIVAVSIFRFIKSEKKDNDDSEA